ncbi:hypothetical protein, partial [Streptomyces sp. SID5785]|uniref:hypothetical protein n=1 Tax=Streptomyces sp. SID5785 TaxID=2690309 RepID=UPI001F370AE7
GGVCTANKDTALYAMNNPFSDVVGWVDAGRPVMAGSGTNPEMLRVTDEAGDFLGYVRRADIDC